MPNYLLQVTYLNHNKSKVLEFIANFWLLMRLGFVLASGRGERCAAKEVSFIVITSQHAQQQSYVLSRLRSAQTG